MLFPVCDVVKFENNFSFLQAILLLNQKNQQKKLNILRMKRAFNMK